MSAPLSATHVDLRDLVLRGVTELGPVRHECWPTAVASLFSQPSNRSINPYRDSTTREQTKAQIVAYRCPLPLEQRPIDMEVINHG
jgi:hypothetical protein